MFKSNKFILSNNGMYVGKGYMSDGYSPWLYTHKSSHS